MIFSRLLLYYFLYCLNRRIVFCEITVKKAGISAITPGDVGVVFYFNILNKQNINYHIRILKKNCKEKHHPECSIHLLGNDMGTILPYGKKKIELVWPNLYVYNRRGCCTVIISYMDDNRTSGKAASSCHFVRYKIYFDTTITNKHILPAYKSAFPHMQTKCATLDLDPLKNCTPVDCLIKYSGCKNFYNRAHKLCTLVNPCVYRNTDHATGYIPTSNTCKNINNNLNMDEIREIRKNLPQTSIPVADIIPYKPNIRCDHGVINNKTGFCDCNKGWMSDEHSLKHYKPDLTQYHMCTIEVENWKHAYKKKINNTMLIFGILSVLIAMSIILLTFCCYCMHKCIKSYRSPASCSTESWVTWTPDGPKSCTDDDFACRNY